jgi:hypothetical protein
MSRMKIQIKGAMREIKRKESQAVTNKIEMIRWKQTTKESVW